MVDLYEDNGDLFIIRSVPSLCRKNYEQSVDQERSYVVHDLCKLPKMSSYRPLPLPSEVGAERPREGRR